LEEAGVEMVRWILSLRGLALLAYVCFCVGISGFALGSFTKITQRYLTVEYNYQTEALIVAGQVIFQWLFMIKSSWSEKKTYGVIALTVSMFGSVLLIPLLAYESIVGMSEIPAIWYFFGVVAIIFLAHHKLIKSEKLPTVLTLTWVLYRLLLLACLTIPRHGHHG
jgi:uncharacterized membrane protein